MVEALACGVPVISSDCKSGPREILAPHTPPEHQTSEPEFAEYGILMPVFDAKFKPAREELDRKEKIWLNTIKEMILNENLRKHYSKKAKIRANDFDAEKIKKEWMRIIDDATFK